MNSKENQTPRLLGLGVLVTRAAHQADHLCGLIEAQGGQVFRLPVLEIVPSGDSAPFADVRQRLPEYDLAVFVSANAVRMAFPALVPLSEWPRALKLAAIGKQTATALNHAGLDVDVVPKKQFTSEALLALEDMRHVAGKHILIVRGEGGREFLATELAERGARVDYAEVYRRVLPEVDTSPILDAWAQGHINAVTVASRESLENLHRLLDETGQQLLASTLLVVGNPRSAGRAAELGLTRVMIANDASDEAMVEALARWVVSHHPE